MSSAAGLVAGSGLTPLEACGLVSGICTTLQAEGATDQDLINVGAGVIDDTDLLNELTENYNAPVTPSTSTDYDSLVGTGLDTLSDGTLGALSLFGGPSTTAIGNTAIVGATSGAATVATVASNAVTAVQNAANSLATWLQNNYIWLIVGVVAVLLLLVWAYGGFKLGFLQG
jgi:hypothetical protein